MFGQVLTDCTVSRAPGQFTIVGKGLNHMTDHAKVQVQTFRRRIFVQQGSLEVMGNDLQREAGYVRGGKKWVALDPFDDTLLNSIPSLPKRDYDRLISIASQAIPAPHHRYPVEEVLAKYRALRKPIRWS